MEKLQNDMKKYCDKNDDNLMTLTGRMETGVLHKLPHHGESSKWTNLYQRITYHLYFFAHTSIGYYVSSITSD